MDIDIDNINTYELGKKSNTIKWGPIYEVIYEAYFIESKNFSDAFMQQCKDNSNEAQFIPLEMKNTLKLNVNGKKDYMHKLSSYVERILNLLKQIRTKMKLNSISKVYLKDRSVGLILNFIVLK